jgi:high-affinity iron transporter
VTFTARHRWVLITLCAVLVGVIVLQALDGGVADPTGSRLSPSSAAFNSGLLVFREGLESILVLAAITAGFRGANQRRPCSQTTADARGRLSLMVHTSPLTKAVAAGITVTLPRLVGLTA